MLVLVSACVPVTVAAQSAGSDGYVRFRGDAGMYSEFYGISGREQRRPSNTFRFFFRPTLEVGNSFIMDFEFLFSDEGSSARQDINSLSVNPKWSWGEAHAGDFSLAFSPLTLNGITIRGAAVEARPGFLHVSAVSGMTQRAVDSDGGGRSYKRRLFGGVVGIGHERGSHLEVIAIRLEDEAYSIATALPDTFADPDSLWNDGEQDPTSVTPQENLVVAIRSRLALADNRFTWNSEVAASAYTRDIRASELVIEDMPNALDGVFTPRIGSNADLAYRTRMDFKLKSLKLHAVHGYTGPGYVSLGLSSLRSDRREFKLGGTLRMHTARFSLEASRQNDNLLDQKTYTKTQNRLLSTLSARLKRYWKSSLSLTRLGMTNDAVNEAHIDYLNWALRHGNVFTFGRNRTLRNISMDLTIQNTNDRSPASRSSGSRTRSGNLRAALDVARGLTLSPTFALVSTDAGGHRMTYTYLVAARYGVRGTPLTTDGHIGLTRNLGASDLRLRLRAGYKFTHRFEGSLEVERSRHGERQGNSSFNETVGRLQLGYRF